jgi:peptidoglycan hydrolase CwlO-like protein
MKISSSSTATFDHFEAKTNKLETKIKETDKVIENVSKNIVVVDKKLEETKKEIVKEREVEK